MTDFLTRTQARRAIEDEVRHLRELTDSLPRALASQLPPEMRFRAERLVRIKLERHLRIALETALAKINRVDPKSHAQRQSSTAKADTSLEAHSSQPVTPATVQPAVTETTPAGGGVSTARDVPAARRHDQSGRAAAHTTVQSHPDKGENAA